MKWDSNLWWNYFDDIGDGEVYSFLNDLRGFSDNKASHRLSRWARKALIDYVGVTAWTGHVQKEYCSVFPGPQ